MKINRSSKVTLKFTNKRKREALRQVMQEYAQIVNFFIDRFWTATPSKNQLLKAIVNLPDTWLSARCRKAAAREAIDMIVAAKERAKALEEEPNKPRHYGRRMCWSSTQARLQKPKAATQFDAWLHLYSIGNGVILDIPVKFHRHYHALSDFGKRTESYVISEDYVQLCFEIETGPKKPEGELVGVDTGINVLAATSYGKLYGTDIREIIEKSNRCNYGSKRQKRLRRYLRHRMDEVAKEIVTDDVRLVVVEKLKGMNHNTSRIANPKRRKCKRTRKLLGAWNFRYWLNRIQMVCEARRSCFRAVPPAYTSQRCPAVATPSRETGTEKHSCVSSAVTGTMPM